MILKNWVTCGGNSMAFVKHFQVSSFFVTNKPKTLKIFTKTSKNPSKSLENPIVY